MRQWCLIYDFYKYKHKIRIKILLFEFEKWQAHSFLRLFLHLLLLQGGV